MMNPATRLMLSTLMTAAAGALVGTPAQAGSPPSEWLDAQIRLSMRTTESAALEAEAARHADDRTRDPLIASTATRTRAAVKTEAIEANRRRATVRAEAR